MYGHAFVCRMIFLSKVDRHTYARTYQQYNSKTDKQRHSEREREREEGERGEEKNAMTLVN